MNGGNKIEKALAEGNLLEKAYKKFKKFLRNIFGGRYRRALFKRMDWLLQTFVLRRMMKSVEVEPNKILFITSRGSYNCNPRAIADEIIRQNLPWQLVWVARKENLKRIDQFPPELKLVTRGSYDFYRELMSAQVWIDNSVNLFYLRARKKESQVLMETWHGSIGLKRFETNSDQTWIKRAAACGKQTDYCISNSTFETELFRSTFWADAEILEYGHARNDILLTDDLERKRMIAQRLRERCDIPEDVKLALYAPTYRDQADFRTYAIDFYGLKSALEARFGGTWCILYRLHFAAKKEKGFKHPKFVIDVSNYEDIQDILLVCNAGVTDYSSWICDFVLTRRPAFFFAADLEEYYTERGFYFPLDSTPFPVAQNNRELINNIRNFDSEAYQASCEAFLADKGCIEDGHAAERVVKKLKEIIEEKKR